MDRADVFFSSFRVSRWRLNHNPWATDAPSIEGGRACGPRLAAAPGRTRRF